MSSWKTFSKLRRRIRFAVRLCPLSALFCPSICNLTTLNFCCPYRFVFSDGGQRNLVFCPTALSEFATFTGGCSPPNPSLLFLFTQKRKRSKKNKSVYLRQIKPFRYFSALQDSCSKSASHSSRLASLGIRQSPLGDNVTLPTFGASGRQERLNCCEKNRR